MRGGFMSRRKVIFSFLGIALLCAFFYFGLWPFIVGGSRMESFCSSLSNGLSVAEVTSLATQKGYRLNRSSIEQQVLVHEPRPWADSYVSWSFVRSGWCPQSMSVTTKCQGVINTFNGKHQYYQYCQCKQL
jgi:hypothetical protein